MKAFKKLFISLIVLTATTSVPAFAATKTVALDVPSMNECSTCPITLKKALTGVQGVSKVDVSLDKKEATVTYDDSKTTVDELTKATNNAGMPSKPKSGVK
jgi:mercuric ion binding protein